MIYKYYKGKPTNCSQQQQTGQLLLLVIHAPHLEAIIRSRTEQATNASLYLGACLVRSANLTQQRQEDVRLLHRAGNVLLLPRGEGEEG